MTGAREQAERAYQALLKKTGKQDTPETRYEFVSNVAKAQGLNRADRRRAGIRPKRERRSWT